MKAMRHAKSYLPAGIIALCLLLTGPVVAQGVFKWVDAEGNVHYGDRVSGGEVDSKSEVRMANANAQSRVTRESLDTDGEETSAGTAPITANSNEAIRLFTTPWCAKCDAARAVFTGRGLSFVEYDIEEDPDARREYNRLGGQGIPLIIVGNRRMDAYNETLLVGMLDNEGF